MECVIITGCRGMDGSILSEKYLAKGYKVIGIDRWEATGAYPNMENLLLDDNFIFETGDITEKEFMYRMIKKYQPETLYNMAAISLVPESFKIPDKVFDINLRSVLNMLEIIREHFPKTKFYQASTSEQIGENTDFPQNTDSRMVPNSPYAIAKLASYNLVRCYRSAFGIFAVNGMLWNHEGERRGPMFVTRKITLHVAEQVRENSGEPLQIGNMDAFRDWGYANNYCDAMILMMESETPDDYAVNTGEAHSVREFIEEVYSNVDIKIRWEGEGMNEKGYNEYDELMVEVNPKFYRPVEVPYLHGDNSKIQEKLGWEPTVKFKELAKIMIEHDLKE